MVLIKLGGRDHDVTLRGDSKTALAWAESERPAGEFIINAALVFTLLCIRFGLDVRWSEFLKGKDNWKSDNLSRLWESGWSIEQAMIVNGLGGAPEVDLSRDPSSLSLLECCNPNRKFATESDFLALWCEIRAAVEGLTPVC